MALTPLGDMLNSPQPDALNILLAGPASLPLTSPLDTSLCMPSTGTMTPSSPLAGHMMTPPGGTPPSPVPGPISVGSPLLNATVTPSLLTVGNLVLPEVPRLRLAESPGASHASVPAGPTLVSKGNCKRGTVGRGLRTLLTDVLARRKGPAPQTTRKPLRILPLERPAPGLTGLIPPTRLLPVVSLFWFLVFGSHSAAQESLPVELMSRSWLQE